MSESLKPIITEHGLSAVLNAHNDGLSMRISAVELGNQGYTVTVNADGYATQTQLHSKQERVGIADGRRVAAHQVNLSFIVEGTSSYEVKELGFYLDDGSENGILFAVWSNPDKALAWKSDSVPLIIGLELILSALPADSVTVQPGSTPLQLVMTRDMAAIGTALANVQLEQLRQADKIKQFTGNY